MHRRATNRLSPPPCGPTGSVEASRGRRGCRVGRSHGLMVLEGGQRPPEGTNRPTVYRPRLQTCVIRPTEQLSRPDLRRTASAIPSPSTVCTGSAHRVVLFRPYGDSHRCSLCFGRLDDFDLCTYVSKTLPTYHVLRLWYTTAPCCGEGPRNKSPIQNLIWFQNTRYNSKTASEL